MEEAKTNPPPKKAPRPRPKDPKVSVVPPHTKPKAPKAPPKVTAKPKAVDPDVVMSDPAPPPSGSGDKGIAVGEPTPGGFTTSSTYLGTPVLVGVPPLSLKDYDPSSDIATLRKSLKGTGADDISAITGVLTTKVKYSEIKRS